MKRGKKGEGEGGEGLLEGMSPGAADSTALHPFGVHICAAIDAYAGSTRRVAGKVTA